MKGNKILYSILVLLVFVATGCDATYDLEISKNKSEVLKVWEVDTDSSDDGMDAYIYPYADYPNIAYPILKKDGTEPEIAEKSSKIKYYNISNLGDIAGLKFEGNLGRNFISNSNIIYSQTSSGQVMEDDISVKINISKVKAFENHPILDNLTINITVNDYEVTSNNADSVDGNIYTWNITRDNYKKKPVKLEINKVKSITDAGNVISYGVKNFFKVILDFFKELPNKEIIGVCVIVIVGSFVTFIYVKRKQTNSNKF